MAFGLPAEGTRRLSLLLGAGAVGGCLVAYFLVLVLYGPPSWTGWWGVMAAILGAVFLGARAVVPAVEWVIAGYRG